MTVIMIALPVGVQTDHIILSHVTTSARTRSVQPGLADVYADLRAGQCSRFHSLATLCRIPGKEQEESPLQLSLVFGAIGLFCLCISVIAGWLANSPLAAK